MATSAISNRAARSQVAGRSLTLDLRIGGTLILLAGAAILMAIITAEALYPATYATGTNEISDLGGTRPPDSVILQPSATIFNVSMMLTGIAVIGASWFVHRAFGRRAMTIPLLLLGAAALGVGVFPGNTGNPHAISAMVTFVSGGVAALCAALVVGPAFRALSAALGAISLLTLVSYMILGDGSPMAAMGVGGIERWIVYPIVIWLVAFGAYLLGRPTVRRHDRGDEVSEGRRFALLSRVGIRPSLTEVVRETLDQAVTRAEERRQEQVR